MIDNDLNFEEDNPSSNDDGLPFDDEGGNLPSGDNGGLPFEDGDDLPSGDEGGLPFDEDEDLPSGDEGGLPFEDEDLPSGDDPSEYEGDLPPGDDDSPSGDNNTGYKAYAAYEPHTQVYYASHSKPKNLNNYEWYRKKYMYRSFISFSFGGRWIEDFNLIATIDTRLQRQLYGNFEHTVTNYDVLDGQFYWGTHFTNNTIEFKLATDGITQIELEDFKYWFQPTKTRELILAEHPNRAIMARLESTPSMSMIPFEKKTSIKINNVDFETSVTLYKGEITINLVMDEPFWYSISNILAKKIKGVWVDKWKNANNYTVNIYNDKDALKIIAEDGIPARDMITSSILLGEQIYIDTSYTMVGNNSDIGTGHSNGDGTNIKYAEVNAEDQTINYGFIGPRIIDQENFIFEKGTDNSLFLYYPGTAPSPVKLSFSLKPIIDSSYVKYPRNSYVSSTHPYEAFVIQGKEKQIFKFTIPSIYNGYNEAIKLFKNVSINTAWIDLATIMKENVHHYYARKWALMVIKSIQNVSSIIDSNNKTAAISFMECFLKNYEGEIIPASFSFDSKTGESIGIIGCRDAVKTVPLPVITAWQDYGNIVNLTENTGDMVRSSYLFIKERNLPNNKGIIEPWTSSHPDTTHRFYHTMEGGLTDVIIQYKYMYY